jgi:hypothetical protein
VPSLASRAVSVLFLFLFQARGLSRGGSFCGGWKINWVPKGVISHELDERKKLNARQEYWLTNCIN